MGSDLVLRINVHYMKYGSQHVTTVNRKVKGLYFHQTSRLKDHFEDLGVNGMITLKWILNSVRGCALDSFVSGYGPMADCCGHDNDFSGPYNTSVY